LMEKDKDEFNRWDAAQTVTLEYILQVANQLLDETCTLQQVASRVPAPSKAVLNAFQTILLDESLEHRFRSSMFVLPSELFVAEWMKPIYPDAIHLARRHLKRQMANYLKSSLWLVFRKLEKELGREYQLDSAARGKRSLKNVCLEYLCSTQDREALSFALEHFRKANNMTDALACLNVLSVYGTEEGEMALAEFYRKWEHEYLGNV
jgi:aminopeptidase N